MHEAEFELFSQSIPGETRTRWLSMITSWELDPTKPDPYKIVSECSSRLTGVAYPY